MGCTIYRTQSNISAGLREADRVLLGILWSSVGVRYKFSGLRTTSLDEYRHSRDFQTIDSSTSNNNTNNLSCPTKIITAIILTIRITLIKLITRITESRNNQPGITNHNINLMRAQAQHERTIIQIQATVTKLLFVHNDTHRNTRTNFQQVLV
jgi:hypothetical protein